jgi:uncharacterized membrane protein YidH (DUF202 family)
LSSPFIEGLQAERTALSWMRTSLSIGVAGAFAVRITLPELGLWGVVIGAFGVALALTAGAIAGSRYRRVVRDLRCTGNLGTDGRVIALTSGSAVVIGVLAILFLLKGF